ncbi:MAG: hypothetical protein GY832_41250 [Chloroflexi bacterium]|nr:hypothetical protein [Chloroflexota bacterium]
MTNLYPSSDIESVTIIVFGPLQKQGILEIGNELGVEANHLQVEEFKQLADIEEAMEGNP